MRIALVARFEKQFEILEVKRRIEQLGHVVTSRWLYERSIYRELTPPEKSLMAECDLYDIEEAELCVMFTGEMGHGYTAAGHKVEFGYALAKGKEVAIVGPRENIFCWMKNVRQHGDVEALLDFLREQKNAEV